MKRLNNKGYLLVEIVVAFVLAMAIAYFLGNITINLNNREQDLSYSVRFNTDKALITKEVMDDVNKYEVANITKADSCGVDNGVDYSDDYTCIDMNFMNGIIKRLRVFNGEGSEKKIVDDKQVYDITYGVYDVENNVWDAGTYIYQDNFDEILKLGKLDVLVEEEYGYDVLKINMPATSIYSDSDYGINIVIPYMESGIENYAVYKQEIWIGNTATLQQAVNISGNGYIIKPLRDIFAEPDVSINKDVIIDTDGKIINMEGDMIIDAVVTINGGGKIVTSNSNNLIEISSDKKLYLEKIILNAEETGIKNNGGLLEIKNDVEITATTYGVNNLEDGIVNMSGGSITTDGDDGCGIYNASIGNITVSGGSISTSGEGSDALANASTGTITMENGSLSTTGERSSGIYNWDSGTINVSGDSKIYSEKNEAVADSSESGIVNIHGGEIISDNFSGISIGLSATLTITGGTIRGKTFGVFNEDGKVYVSGEETYISASGEGDSILNESGNGLCNCGDSGKTVIIGGTIISSGENAYGVLNRRAGGILIIGSNDDIVNTASPVIISELSYGLRNGVSSGDAGTFEWYDGVIYGTSGYLYSDIVPTMPSGYSPFIENLDDGVQKAYLVK